MDENILVLRDVCKTFPGVKALDHVDFDVKKGEVLALAGGRARSTPFWGKMAPVNPHS